MSPILIGFFAAASVAAWVYNKSMQRTGNNTHNSIIAAVTSGVIAFIVVLTILSLIDSSLAN